MPTYVIYYNQGNSNGPFDIYLSGSSGLNLYASNISKQTLINGYSVTFPDGIPSSSVDVFDLAYGCFNDQNVPFPSPFPSNTPSISITPTQTPSISITPTQTPSITITPSITVTPGNSPSPTRTPSITRTPSNSVPTSYTSYGITLGYSSAYQACVIFNTSGFNGGWIYVVGNFSIGVGTRIYQLDGFGNYVPIIGGNKWYAIGAWYIGFANSYQINNTGYVIDTAYTGCILI